MTVTLLILPEAAVTEMPAFGLALTVPFAGVTLTWAAGDAVGVLACPAWLLPVELPDWLEQAAANRAMIPHTAMMPSLNRWLVGRSSLPARLRSLSSTLALLFALVPTPGGG
ncbi:MAG TPA: hypothetical protein VLW44_06340 [Streptosporangiaceae bacterium]|nr:hypothetical protein [Streptosporangiaceae bacterium]